MPVSKRRAFAVAGFSLLLAGCGEGWETVKYSDKVPYTMERTAGDGVMYVRAKLMPEKELKLADDLEKQLSGSKTKGYGAPKTRPPEASAAQPEAGASVAEVQKAEPHAGAAGQAGAQGYSDVSPEAGSEALQHGDEGSSMTSEQIMMQKLLEGDEGAQLAPSPLPSNRITASAIEPQAGEDEAVSSMGSPTAANEGFPLEPPPVRSLEAPDQAAEEMIEEDTSSGFIAEKQIVVPKKEMYKPVSEGERQLNEIYDDGAYQTQD